MQNVPWMVLAYLRSTIFFSQLWHWSNSAQQVWSHVRIVRPSIFFPHDLQSEEQKLQMRDPSPQITGLEPEWSSVSQILHRERLRWQLFRSCLEARLSIVFSLQLSQGDRSTSLSRMSTPNAGSSTAGPCVGGSAAACVFAANPTGGVMGQTGSTVFFDQVCEDRNGL